MNRGNVTERLTRERVRVSLRRRGRVIARKAYADWSYFDEDRRMLTRSHVELIEIPQRMGAVRKNAADIKRVIAAFAAVPNGSLLVLPSGTTTRG